MNKIHNRQGSICKFICKNKNVFEGTNIYKKKRKK